jgi:putative tricarboxylic transport membrane protein
MLDNMLLGFESIMHWMPLLAIVVGSILGYLIGAMPGLGPTLGVALLIPFTFELDVVTSIVGLVSLYMAAEYGASITAILINTPGTAGAVATAWDGYPMACRGEAGKALTVSIVSSGFGALTSGILLDFTATYLAEFALYFGPAEYFALGVFGLSLVSSLGGKSLTAGAISLFVGLLLTTIGLDPVNGMPRFSFTPDLFSGIPLIPALLGLYAISEVFMMIESKEPQRKSIPIKGILAAPPRLFKGLIVTIMRSSLIGYVIGVIPGAGTSIASLVSYNEAKRASKTPEKFGTGAIEGLSASETANNAAVSGALVPLLALGIPGSATTAVMIGALMIHGVQPGPMLFLDNPEIPYGVFAALLLGVFVMVAMGLLGVRFWIKVIDLPRPVLAASITGICFIGAYSDTNSMFPIFVMLLLGIIGYIFRKLSIPLAPIVLALVLGPLVESSFRKALTISDGNWMVFLQTTIGSTLLFLSALSFVLPLLRSARKAKKDNKYST